jgi:D-alanyl-D-alanine carboxypeptidase
MSRRRRAIAAALVVAAAACGSSGSQSHGPGSTTTRPPKQVAVAQSALDALADRYRASCKAPGAAIGLRTSDGAEHFAVAGRLAAGVPLTRSSQFLAGSVTKLFVATVAYQLVAHHDLALDDPVSKYLPGWPRGDEITVAMLLGHRSGMGDFGNDFSAQLRELVLANLKRVYRYDEVLDLVRAVPPVANPGTTYHYSNANYIVLGAILQRITRENLGELMQSRVIEPLGITRTFYGPDNLRATDAVVFHGLFDVAGTGHPIDIGAFPRAAALTVDPAGAGLFSTIPDLLTFAHTLFAGNRLLAPAQRAALSASVSTLNARDLLLDRRFSVHGHGGASPGAQTIVAYDSAHDATVAVWCNRLDPGEQELTPSVIAARGAFELSI